MWNFLLIEGHDEYYEHPSLHANRNEILLSRRHNQIIAGYCMLTEMKIYYREDMIRLLLVGFAVSHVFFF